VCGGELPFMRRSRRWLSAAAAASILLGVGGVGPVRGDAPAVDAGPTPRAQCGPGSKPETGTQGRVSAAEVASGRAAQGYTCNTQLLSHFGDTGGFKVHRYIDGAGHECAFYDSTLLFPTALFLAPGKSPGVFVLDMTDPAHPVQTATLVTPAMLSPHESLSLNQKRGLLVADMGYPIFNPGFVDVYDVSQDCRHPALKSSLPLGILGHEGALSPDGNTFYVTSAGATTLAAVDISNPSAPTPVLYSFDFRIHGLNVSDDGNRLYMADLGNPGLTILDVSQVQQRVPSPKATVVSHISWPEVSIPQVPIPVKIGGHPYLVEIDEYSQNALEYDPASPVGAARIIDIGDDTKPKVVSNIRLEVNQAGNRAGDQRNDPGASFSLQGYAGHYCAVPTRLEPGVVACSFIASGMRLFDIRDPLHPKEIAYANFPTRGTSPNDPPSSFAMSAPAFVPERAEIWYADGNSGFYALRVTNGVWPFPAPATKVAGESFAAAPPAAAPAAVRPAPRAQLAATGGTVPLVAVIVMLALALALRRLSVPSTPGRASR
jgi:hypothetical protein